MCEYINDAIIQEDFSMEKYIFDEGNGLWYELQGDYYIPCLTVLDQDESPIGIWGQRHLRYIKAERKVLYTELLTSGKLNSYLANINEQATEQILKHDTWPWLVQRGHCVNVPYPATASSIVISPVPTR